MSRYSVTRCIAVFTLVSPLLLSGCQLNRLERSAARRNLSAGDVYVQRARNMQSSNGTAQNSVIPVAYHGQADGAVPPPSHYATSQPIGPPAAGQYSAAAMQSLARPFHSPSQSSTPRRSCSSFG
jgi:hypothetical protein